MVRADASAGWAARAIWGAWAHCGKPVTRVQNSSNSVFKHWLSVHGLTIHGRVGPLARPARRRRRGVRDEDMALGSGPANVAQEKLSHREVNNHRDYKLFFLH